MHSIAWWPTVAVLAVATFTDLRNRRIPNWLVLPFLAGGLGVAGWLHGWDGLGKSAEGLLLGLVAFVVEQRLWPVASPVPQTRVGDPARHA